MPSTILLFFVGLLSSLFFKKPPSLLFILILLLTFISLRCITTIFSAIQFVGYFALTGVGCCWGLLHAHFLTSNFLPFSSENRPVLIRGLITSLPVKKNNSTSINFRVLEMDGKPSHFNVHLNCFECPYSFQVGNSWQLVARLKRPHALMNPGSFDVEKYYFQNHLIALGNILPDNRNQFLVSHWYHYPIQRIREFLQQKILNQCGKNEFCGILLALTLGITTSISTSQWQVFRNTGTNHLVAISGLHIGLVATLFSKVIGMIWSRLPYGPLFVPIIYIEGIFGVSAAIIYSCLSGLSSSTQRSLIMIIFVMLATISRRNITTARALLLALVSILIFDPFAVLGIGFWLSFIAVSLLIYGMNGRLDQTSFWWKWGRAQWVTCIGMMPSVIYFFQQTSLLSIPANIVAIPWVSFLVVPVCLVGVCLLLLSVKMGGACFKIGLLLLQGLWFFLEKLTHLSDVIWNRSFQNNLEIFFSHLAAYITLFPEGLMHRLLASICWLPFIFPIPNNLKINAMQLVVFDVGQGLATMIRTSHHVMIFDTGVKINDNFDMGKTVILPYLMKLGIKHIDVLTVSHGDNDHIGGAQSLLAACDISKIITSVPERFKGLHPIRCREGISWNWDGVNFKFLSPVEAAHFTGNNSSCVLKASNGKQSILLTGDIERQAEELLVERHGKELASTVLIAPHHGSKTSSSQPFVEKVAPHFVIFSCGYLNSYKHPHLQAIERYVRYKTKMLNTVYSGAITMTLDKDSDKVRVQEYRKLHQNIWHQTIP